MNWLNKKTTFAILISAAALHVFIQWYKVSNLCTFDKVYDRLCADFFVSIKNLAFFFVILLLPWLLTLPFRAAIFDTWKKFAVFTIPPILVATYFIGQMSSGGGVGVAGFHPGLVYIPVLYGAYFLISIGIIIYAIVRERRGRHK